MLYSHYLKSDPTALFFHNIDTDPFFGCYLFCSILDFIMQ